jgi:hypothetical protein
MVLELASAAGGPTAPAPGWRALPGFGLATRVVMLRSALALPESSAWSRLANSPTTTG